tara:strand:+ start:1283 stop:1519 length:237 start_codon:yes stop_codon:yes gene_type:complete
MDEISTAFLKKELNRLRREIAEEKEDNKLLEAQQTYGYQVNPETGRLMNIREPKRRVLKKIRIKKSESFKKTPDIGEE